MVFIGIVTRVNSNNGEIFVKVQNGFELEELQNVIAETPSNGDLLRFNGSSNCWENFSGYSGTITVGMPPAPMINIQVENGLIVNVS